MFRQRAAHSPWLPRHRGMCWCQHRHREGTCLCVSPCTFMSYNILQNVAATFKDIKVCVNLAQPFTHAHMYTYVRPRPHIVMHLEHCQVTLTLFSQYESPALCAVQHKSHIQLVLGPIRNSTSFVLPASQCVLFTKAS